MYDVFISYSYDGDELLSERVQQGLSRFAKPWYRRQALAVFRDRSSLSANPGLWSSIAGAIDESRYFLLLASPEAARSPWVAREVEQWRGRHGSNGLLILLTNGEIGWDAARNDFDQVATTAVPSDAITGCFSEEPRYVDMRWARDEAQFDLDDGRFRDQIAEIAAPIHGVAKDELTGEDVRQHRRTLRHAWAAAIALGVVALAAVATSVFAVRAARSATRNAEQAESARLLAADQREEAGAQTRRAEREGERALRAQRDAERNAATARREKTNALGLAADLVRQQRETETRTLGQLALSLAYRSRVAGDYGASNETALLLAAQAAAFGARSGQVDASDLESALIEALQKAGGQFAQGSAVVKGQFVSAAQFSPDGRVLATLNSELLRLTYVDGDHPPVDIALRENDVVTEPSAFAFGDGTIAVLNHDLSVDLFDTNDGRVLAHMASRFPPPDNAAIGDVYNGAIGMSGSLADGYVSAAVGNRLRSWRLEQGRVTAIPGIDAAQTGYVELTASGTRAVMRNGGGSTVFDLRDHWSPATPVPVPVGKFSPDGRYALSRDGADWSLYDLDQRRVVWSVPTAVNESWFAFTPDGSIVTSTCTTMSCVIDNPTIRLRSPTDGTVRVALHPRGGNDILSTAFVVRGNGILVGDRSERSDGYTEYWVFDWALDVTELANAACTESGRNLTEREWQRYVGPLVPYERTCPAFA